MLVNIFEPQIYFKNSCSYSKDLVPVKLILFKLPAACFLVRLVSFSGWKFWRYDFNRDFLNELIPQIVKMRACKVEEGGSITIDKNHNAALDTLTITFTSEQEK